jgi:hypothetical protein
MPVVKRWLACRVRFRVYFALTSGSWLSQVERRFAGPTDKALRVHRSADELTSSIEAYVAQANQQAKPYSG